LPDLAAKKACRQKIYPPNARRQNTKSILSINYLKFNKCIYMRICDCKNFSSMGLLSATTPAGLLKQIQNPQPAV
jgi:hypothetical protein